MDGEPWPCKQEQECVAPQAAAELTWTCSQSFPAARAGPAAPGDSINRSRMGRV